MTSADDLRTWLAANAGHPAAKRIGEVLDQHAAMLAALEHVKAAAECNDCVMGEDEYNVICAAIRRAGS
jgi:hypothetical protein